MEDDVIASRGFTNDLLEEFSLFVETENDALFISMEHRAGNHETVIKLKASPEVLEEIKIMCEAALEQIKNTKKDFETFRNY